MPQSIPSVLFDAGFTQEYVHLTFTLVLHLALKYTSNKSDYLKDYQNLDKIFCRFFFFLFIVTRIIVQPERLEES